MPSKLTLLFVFIFFFVCCCLHLCTYSCVDLLGSAASPLELKFLVNRDNRFCSPVGSPQTPAPARHRKHQVKNPRIEPINERTKERIGGGPAPPRKSPSAAAPQQWGPLPFRPRRGRPGSLGGGALAGAGSARPLLLSRPVPPRASAGRAAVRDAVYAEPLRLPAAARPGSSFPAGDPPAVFPLPSPPHEAAGRVRSWRSRRRQRDPVRPHRRGEAQAAGGLEAWPDAGPACPVAPGGPRPPEPRGRGLRIPATVAPPAWRWLGVGRRVARRDW